jgi:hypothetical protein
MTVSTLMVHLDLEHSNDTRLRIASDLAEKFDAKLIGIAAGCPQPTHYAGGDFAQGLVTHQRSEIKKQIAEAEDRFRSAVQQRAHDVEWRSAMERPVECVTREHGPQTLSLPALIGMDCCSISLDSSTQAIW